MAGKEVMEQFQGLERDPNTASLSTITVSESESLKVSMDEPRRDKEDDEHDDADKPREVTAEEREKWHKEKLTTEQDKCCALEEEGKDIIRKGCGRNCV